MLLFCAKVNTPRTRMAGVDTYQDLDSLTFDSARL